MPQRLRRVHHRVDADFLRQIGRDGVDRMRQRVGQRQRAVRAAAEIGRRPAIDVHRLVVARIPRRESRFQRREIDEGLEGRAGLAMRLGGAVETCSRRNRRRRSWPMTAPSEFHHHDRGFAGTRACTPCLPVITLTAACARGFLHARFQRGVHDHIAATAPAAMEAIAPALRRRRCRGNNCAHPSLARSMMMAGWALASSACACVIAPVSTMASQHAVGARLGGGQIAPGREHRRRAGQRRQHRGLRQASDRCADLPK